MRIECKIIYSSNLNREISCRVILPSNPNGKSLYLLHGYNEDSSCWLEKTNIIDWAETYGITVIMPDAGDGYYQDNERKKERMKTFIGEELVEITRKQYSLSPKKEDTWIAGVSMGGFGSLLIGSSYDKTFGKIGCISGAFVIPSLVIWNFGVLGNKLSTRDYFLDCFGDFQLLEGSEKDPEAMAYASLSRKTFPKLFLFCGTEDKLFEENRKLKERLMCSGARICWEEAKGDHEWNCFLIGFEKMLEWIQNDEK